MILFYSEEITNRIAYAAQLIFTQILKVEVRFSNYPLEFRQWKGPKINYSKQKFGGEIYLKPHGLLHAEGVSELTIKTVQYQGENYFFESSGDSVLPFDPFAASFYLVARYEEYLKSDFDKFNRFQAKNSILEKYGLLQKPIVNIWAERIAELFQAKYPELVFPTKKFNFISTIDIDNAWAFRHKGIWRTAGGLVKTLLNGNFSECTLRRKVLTGAQKDPFDTYPYLNSIFKGNEEKVKYFILLGDYNEFDKNIAHKNKSFRNLIRDLASRFDVGIHPSFVAGESNDEEKTKNEKLRLQDIVGKEIKISRQHFLKLKFPQTYEHLRLSGIEADFTMGYAEQIGFRAGICTPYFFYDLKREAATNLLIVPFQVMDVSLRNYLQLSPQQAMLEIEKIMVEVKNVGGTFVSLWHNETVNNQGLWEGWREVFEKMNELGFKWANE